MATQSRTQVTSKNNENIQHAFSLALAQNETKKAQEQVKAVQVEHEKTKKLAEQAKKKQQDTQKKHQNLEKDHIKTKKELHALKLRYDGNYAFDYSEKKKGAMKNAREAKANKTKTMREKGKEKRAAAKKVSSAGARKSRSRK